MTISAGTTRSSSPSRSPEPSPPTSMPDGRSSESPSAGASMSIGTRSTSAPIATTTPSTKARAPARSRWLTPSPPISMTCSFALCPPATRSMSTTGWSRMRSPAASATFVTAYPSARSARRPIRSATPRPPPGPARTALTTTGGSTTALSASSLPRRRPETTPMTAQDGRRSPGGPKPTGTGSTTTATASPTRMTRKSTTPGSTPSTFRLSPAPGP